MNNFDNDFEEAIRFLSSRMPPADKLEKPTLFHSIRVGVYLYKIVTAERSALPDYCMI